MENMDNQHTMFSLGNELLDGWVLTCWTDGCNYGSTLKGSQIMIILFISLLLTIISQF